MATLPFVSPRLKGIPGVDSPTPRFYIPLQGGAWREGSILTLSTTGTINTPTPQGSMITTAGPSLGTSPVPFQIVTAATSVTQGAVTVTATATGAPAVPFTYYVVVTYTATTNESLPSQEFIINAPAGLLPIISVSATGAPAAATSFAAYVGVYTGGEARQQAALTTTALGATYTFAYPLTNNRGAQQAASNINSNILGIALADSGAVYALGVGGSSAAGGYNQTLGIWANPPALGSSPEAQYAYVASLAGLAPLEISLKQSWSNALIGSAVGLTLDATSGWFVADTTATACGTIIEKVTGAGSYASYNDVGGLYDVGARVFIEITTGAI